MSKYLKKDSLKWTESNLTGISGKVKEKLPERRPSVDTRPTSSALQRAAQVLKGSILDKPTSLSLHAPANQNDSFNASFSISTLEDLFSEGDESEIIQQSKNGESKTNAISPSSKAMIPDRKPLSGILTEKAKEVAQSAFDFMDTHSKPVIQTPAPNITENFSQFLKNLDTGPVSLIESDAKDNIPKKLPHKNDQPDQSHVMSNLEEVFSLSASSIYGSGSRVDSSALEDAPVIIPTSKPSLIKESSVQHTSVIQLPRKDGTTVLLRDDFNAKTNPYPDEHGMEITEEESNAVESSIQTLISESIVSSIPQSELSDVDENHHHATSSVHSGDRSSSNEIQSGYKNSGSNLHENETNHDVSLTGANEIREIDYASDEFEYEDDFDQRSDNEGTPLATAIAGSPRECDSFSETSTPKGAVCDPIRVSSPEKEDHFHSAIGCSPIGAKILPDNQVTEVFSTKEYSIATKAPDYEVKHVAKYNLERRNVESDEKGLDSMQCHRNKSNSITLSKDPLQESPSPDFLMKERQISEKTGFSFPRQQPAVAYPEPVSASKLNIPCGIPHTSIPLQTKLMPSIVDPEYEKAKVQLREIQALLENEGTSSTTSARCTCHCKCKSKSRKSKSKSMNHLLIAQVRLIEQLVDLAKQQQQHQFQASQSMQFTTLEDTKQVRRA
jgi:hypothetical protein